jgi:epoxide hydrolase 4
MSAATIQLEHTTITTNGVNLHVVQAGPKDGTPVILLHGFPEFWYGWRKQIEHLAARGYRVWAPDQRGYNLSEKPAGVEAYRLDTLGNDVVGLIDAMGVQKVYLVGHDWGAAVAWWVAINHPLRIKKLGILNVPHLSVMRKALATSMEQRLKSWYIGFFQLPLLPEAAMLAGGANLADVLFKRTANPGSFSNAEIAEYKRAWKQDGALTGMLNWYRALVRKPPTPPADVRVHVPTLIIWGANDVALTQEMAEASLKYCDDGRLVMLENATHWVQHDEPARVNELLTEFLK